MSLLTKVFGTRNDKIIKGIMPLVNEINRIEPEFEKLTDDELRAKTQEFKDRLAGGADIDSLLCEAFATCREAAKRTIGQRHYDVQLIGGVVLHRGNIAEMKTGEGKTLTATLPVYLRALAGKGAHVVTVNDYLAKRDCEWMSEIYNFLGLTTGTILHGLSDEQRKEAYAADITYGTNNEFGFDFLRDNMKTEYDELVQRGHYFSIVDEVDSILIDEARTPLIISGAVDTNTDLYVSVNAAIPGLQKDSDYMFDEKSRTVTLTEDGISKLEKRLRVENLYEPQHIDVLHHVQQALKAHVAFKKDVDYVVRNGEVLIVDEHTGRLMPGRRYSDGLHGALEAKEHVPIQRESQTLASITFQNLFRMYEVLSGMTGTADTEAVEFQKIYTLETVVVPTNVPIQRKDEEDVIYLTATEKFNAIADEIQKAQAKGQPVLVGTVSVEKSELLSRLLDQRKVPHEVLNAKNHAREAEVVATAGHAGRVTIATNMAGRGTDIKLGEGVVELGGLYVVGTERHDSRRIDNQLRGRSGRQGDPGRSQFFLSLEDDLMRIFASDRLQGIMSRLGMKEGEAIVSPMVSRAIEKAQKRVEEQNFSSRKHVLEYDDVMNQQRQVVYKRRKAALMGQSEVDFLEDAVAVLVEGVLDRHNPERINADKYDFDAIKKELSGEFNVEVSVEGFDASELDVNAFVDSVAEQLLKAYKEKLSEIGEENTSKLESYVYLQVIDQAWRDHLVAMDSLKDAVSLRGYAQKDPLQEYKKEAFTLFEQMMIRIEEETALSLLRMPAPTLSTDEMHVEEPSILEMKHPDATRVTQDILNGAGSRPEPRGVPADDGMIYHGSREQFEEERAPAPQTFRREGEKIGRNDPCPCGSGKKYKKCHGKAGGSSAGQPSL